MISLKQLLDVCRRLNEKHVKYALIGGWAIYIHGYERATRDIDLILEDSAANILRLKEALCDLLPEACDELDPDDVNQNVVVRMASETLVVDLIRSVGEIDYARLKGHIQNESINGVVVPVADLQTMIELKRGVRDIDKRDYLFLKGKLFYISRKGKPEK